MRNTMKAATIESKFPLLAVEHDCIISKDADITVAFRVDLPELFTVTSAEYEAIHSSWAKAIKVLPDYSVIQNRIGSRKRTTSRRQTRKIWVSYPAVLSGISTNVHS